MEVNNNILLIGEILNYLNPKLNEYFNYFRSQEICISNDILDIVYEYEGILSFKIKNILSIDFKNETAYITSYSNLNSKINNIRKDISFNDLFGNDKKNKKEFIEIVNNIGSDEYDLSKNDLYIKYKLEKDI